MLTALINEAACVGCGICLTACPFDAIIGSCGQMHTVLVAECIGCKLCVDPCPVSCISLVKRQSGPEPGSLALKNMVAHSRQRRIAKILRTTAEEVTALATKETIAADLQQILARSD